MLATHGEHLRTVNGWRDATHRLHRRSLRWEEIGRSHGTHGRITASSGGPFVGAVDGEVVAILALLLGVLGGGATSNAPSMAEIAGLGNALQLLGPGVVVVAAVIGGRRHVVAGFGTAWDTTAGTGSSGSVYQLRPVEVRLLRRKQPRSRASCSVGGGGGGGGTI